MDIRTDLALESFSADALPKSVHIATRGKAFNITEITIDDDSCLSSIGKGKGKYITLEGSDLSCFSDDYELMTEELSQELAKLVPDGEILVVGLGNNGISESSMTAMKRSF